MESLMELLDEQVKDLFSAESQLVKALPKMAKKASTPELKKAIESHLKETIGHVERLRQVADLLGTKPTGKTCAAMQGLIDEGKEVIDEKGKGAVIDAALVAAAQRVEHYEIAAYGNGRALAKELQKDDVADLFNQTLDEESAADKKLTEICQSSIFPNASHDGQASEDAEDDDK